MQVDTTCRRLPLTPTPAPRPSSRLGTVISVGALCGNLSGMVILQSAGWLIGGGYGYGPLFGLAAVAYLLALLPGKVAHSQGA